MHGYFMLWLFFFSQRNLKLLLQPRIDFYLYNEGDWFAKLACRYHPP